MVVDDEEAVRAMMRTALERSGYEVVTAEDGQAGLDVLTGCDDVHCIVTDIDMLGMDGLSFTRQAKIIRPCVPIVVVSGRDEDEMRPAALASGASMYFQKPVRLLKEVLPAIQTLLGD